MKITQITALFFCIFLLSACSSKPSDDDLKPVVADFMSGAMPDQRCFQLKNIKKTNGFERNDKTYQVTAEWEMVAVKSFETSNYSSVCVEKPKYDSMKSPNDVIGLLGMLGEKSENLAFANMPEKGFLKQIGCEKLKKGESCFVKMEMIFRKTEKGWDFVGLPK